MLRRTSPVHVFMCSTGVSMLGNGWHPTNAELDKMMLRTKQQVKRARQLGNWDMKNTDRWFQAGDMGSPKEARFYIKKSVGRHQATHHTERQGVDVHAHKHDLSQGTNPHAVTREVWTGFFSTRHTFSLYGVGKWMKNANKDNSIAVLEEWGVRFTDLAALQFKLEDMKYVKHKLYKDNFKWKKEPFTRAGPSGIMGDADYQWKGEELCQSGIDYSSYGAATKTPVNEFRSLWQQQPKTVVAAVKAAAAAPAKAAAAVSKAAPKKA
jgi:hypothetical protein